MIFFSLPLTGAEKDGVVVSYSTPAEGIEIRLIITSTYGLRKPSG
jgi:hypothetical protein